MNSLVTLSYIYLEYLKYGDVLPNKVKKKTLEPSIKKVHNPPQQTNKEQTLTYPQAPSNVMQLISNLYKEVDMLKKATTVILMSNKPKTIKQELPSYIITLEQIGVSEVKRPSYKTKKDFNAIQLQKLIRGYLVRHRLTKYRFQQYCIRIIQSWIKGHLTRKRLKGSKGSVCNDCKKNEAEINKLKDEVKEMQIKLNECMKGKEQHEKALNYVFSHIKNLVEQVRKKDKSTEECKQETTPKKHKEMISKKYSDTKQKYISERNDPK